ncbi:MAG: NAD-dependent epimerase [Aquabacterium sp.]|uniref:NAD-dependent epimerase n=1 Tax=Aquabacterium sp. TaxID=1872578 RepID=UPI00121453A4|nr:NAD-dependent epimerase [Aquabacterium sp.]TAK93833.1 MAG: NAD-dependent epimerase [Aquabacterium sp.]
MSKVLVTGAAGFIGMHVCLSLLQRGDTVVGIDNLNDYYDPQLKKDRIAHIGTQCPGAAFRFELLDIGDNAALQALFDREQFDSVVHLAAQAGVRYSLQNPHAYVHSNLAGFVNMLEACRHHKTGHLVYASSSSVYGGNVRMPFSEEDAVDHPVSLYAATKKANELMAHTYSHLYGLPTTGLRFFTVYGPWGRPDMAPMLFTRAILAGEPIKVFNHGKMQRDFTYIDDIVKGVIATLDKPPQAQPDFDRQDPSAASSWAPYRVFNIGNSEPVALMDFIQTIETALGCKAKLDLQPMAPGDVAATYASVEALTDWTGVRSHTDLATGIGHFTSWYRAYFKG